MRTETPGNSDIESDTRQVELIASAESGSIRSLPARTSTGVVPDSGFRLGDSRGRRR